VRAIAGATQRADKVDIEVIRIVARSSPKRRQAPAGRIATGVEISLAICRGWSSYARHNDTTNRQGSKRESSVESCDRVRRAGSYSN
jgi:hypothetical protein